MLPLSHEVQSGPPYFLDCLWTLGVARSSLSLRLAQQFMSNGISYTKFMIINIELLHGLVLFH